MPYLPLRTGATVLFLTSALIFSGCQCCQQAAGGSSSGGKQVTAGGSSSGGTRAKVRIPNGAKSRHEAAVKFFNAYKTHDRPAAKEVAADAAINALVFDPAAGTNPTLQLIDDSHIYYEGGSIELKFAQNSAGRWYVGSVTSRAD